MTDPHRPLKTAFGRYATGITVVSCLDQDASPVCITVNSFASVALEPAMVMWCIEKRASSFEAFMAADHYAVSVLKAGDSALSDRFASHAPQPLGEDEREIWITGAPLLRQRLAGFDCRVCARHEASDHVILVGEVVKFDANDGAPLIYYASNYYNGPEAE